jgi:hypothetical protein
MVQGISAYESMPIFYSAIGDCDICVHLRPAAVQSQALTGLFAANCGKMSQVSDFAEHLFSPLSPDPAQERLAGAKLR